MTRAEMALYLPESRIEYPDNVQEAAALIGVAVDEYDKAKHWPLVWAKTRMKYVDALLKESKVTP